MRHLKPSLYLLPCADVIDLKNDSYQGCRSPRAQTGKKKKHNMRKRRDEKERSRPACSRQLHSFFFRCPLRTQQIFHVSCSKCISFYQKKSSLYSMLNIFLVSSKLYPFLRRNIHILQPLLSRQLSLRKQSACSYCTARPLPPM